MALCGLAAVAGVTAADWGTWHGDLQRSGCYDEFPAGELKLLWRRDLAGELTGPRAEVIISRGVALMGTLAGRLHAWDAATGEVRWRLDMGAPIMHSVEAGGEEVFVAAMDGTLRAVRISDGSVAWTARGEAGFWAAPVFAEGWVFIGDRAGALRALDARREGAEVWTVRAEGPVLAPASLSHDGSRVVFTSEDMRVRCVETLTGRLLWCSERLPGVTLRDYAPTIYRAPAAQGREAGEELVFVTSSPAADFHALLDAHEKLLVEWRGFEGADPRFLPGGAAEVAAEQDRILRRLSSHPEERTFHALRMKDGSEPWVAPIFYSGGCHNPLPPPTWNRRTGEIFVQVRSAYGIWDGGGEVRSYAAPARLDPATGRWSLVGHSHPPGEPGRAAGAPDIPWGSFAMIGDETQLLSCAEGRLFSNHQGFMGELDLSAGKVRRLLGRRDTYGGYRGPGFFGWEPEGPRQAAAAGEPYGIINEWHGPSRSIAAVAGGRVYYHSGGQVLCLAPQP